MTKSKIMVIAVLLASMVSNVFALDLTKWKFQAQVTVEDGTGQYGRLTLTPDIYNSARDDLADIRLLDDGGQQVPYVLAKPGDITDRLKYSPSLINRSMNEDGAAMVTLDFGKQIVKNQIEVETGGNNFRRPVKVEGSNDNVQFFIIVEQAYVFAVDYRTRFEQVDLPANDYRYLRISVAPMADEQKRPVINEIRASKFESKLAERQPVNMVQVEHSENGKSKSSIYVYDLAYRHLPVSEIELGVADNAFYRYVTVDGRDAATRKVKIDSEDNRQRFREVEVEWKRIISGTIYRYPDADGKNREKLILRIPSKRRVYRYLRIAIRNYDDKPLAINSASAKMIADNIVFAAQDNIAPTLYVGSQSASKPQYDLARRLSRPLQVKARMAKLSNIIDNPLFGQVEEKPVPWTEKHKVLLWIIMGIIVAVLGAFILKSFTSIQAKEAQS
ncbi:MAG: DUF3999 family protein [Planctomycetota bacterium]|jgi:hypothetical protein